MDCSGWRRIHIIVSSFIIQSFEFFDIIHVLSSVIDHVKTTITTATTLYIPNEQEYFSEDSPKIDVEVIVNKADLNFISSVMNTKSTTTEQKDDIIARISTTDIWMSLKRMSVSRSIECMVDLQTIQIFGMQCNNKKPPILMMGIAPEFSPFVHVEFDLFPVDKKSDYRFHITVEPLKIFHDAPTINRIVECFSTHGVVAWHPQTKSKQPAYVGIGLDFLNKKIFDMKMNLKGVSLILTQSDVSQSDFSMIRLQFNNMILKSCLNKNEHDNNNCLFQEKPEERKLYMKYKWELSDLRIIYSDSNKNHLHILRRTPLIDINFYKYKYKGISSNDTTLPKWRIGGKIAMGDIQLSKTTLIKLMPHLKSLPLFYSDIITITKRVNRYFSVFSSHAPLISDISIYNCCLQLLMHPQTSIRTDFHVHTSKSKDKSSMDKEMIITLKEPTITRQIVSTTKQSSQVLYRNDCIKLIYTKSSTNL